MLFTRHIESKIGEYLKSDRNEILFIWGPRRSGKTTLLEKLSKKINERIFNFNTISDRELFVPRREALEKIVSEHKVLMIDEVQNYPESTVPLKVLFDEFKPKIIATGSSELRQKSKEFDSLAGRYSELCCLPLTLEEIRQNNELKSYEEANFFRSLYENVQIFGSYPEIYSNTKLSENRKIKLLEKIIDAYVLKDIVSIYDLKNTKLARDILLKIALQLGSEVSVREIANSFQANVGTVSNYIEIFIRNYILVPLYPFKTNARRAVSENRKLYFMDLGLRNALVKDFRPTGLRPDKGGVFENFVVSEIAKAIRNYNLNLNMYFYREYGGREVDIVLEDYKKNYWTFEVKSGKGISKDAFPIKNRFSVINVDNLFKTILEITKSVPA